MSEMRLAYESRTYNVQGTGKEVGAAVDKFVVPEGWRLESVEPDVILTHLNTAGDIVSRTSIVHYANIIISRTYRGERRF